jgi:hypothetical protein
VRRGSKSGRIQSAEPEHRAGRRSKEELRSASIAIFTGVAVAAPVAPAIALGALLARPETARRPATAWPAVAIRSGAIALAAAGRALWAKLAAANTRSAEA